jgi:hypothetical protein
MRRGDALRAVVLLLALSSAFADELGAVIPWEMLAQVSPTRQKDRYVPIVSGTFVLVRDDSGGLLYRLTEATLVEK